MTDFNLADFFLTGMVTYGSLALGVALFVGALGLLVPGTLFVLAAGAFVRQGVMDLAPTAGLGLLGVIVGDCASYAIGYFARGWVQRRFGQSSTWQKAQEIFERRGGTAIYLTRFLITPLAVPTNLIAGGSGYLFRKYLFYDVAGELTWVVFYGGLGYAFGSQWETINQFFSDFSIVLVGVAALGLGIYLLIHLRNQNQFTEQN